MPDLGSDFVIVFHGPEGESNKALVPMTSSKAKPWFIAGAFVAAAAGVAALAAFSEDEKRGRSGSVSKPTLDFVYQEGCSACASMDRILDEAKPFLRKLGVTVKPIAAEKIPADWPMKVTPSLQLRVGSRALQLSQGTIEKIISTGDQAVPTLIRWAKRAVR